jgi:hypothetical protein
MTSHNILFLCIGIQLQIYEYYYAVQYKYIYSRMEYGIRLALNGIVPIFTHKIPYKSYEVHRRIKRLNHKKCLLGSCFVTGLTGYCVIYCAQSITAIMQHGIKYT